MTDNFLDKVNNHTQKALAAIKKIDAEKKFSSFAIDKFNEAGIKGTSSKAEDMLDELYDIAFGEQEIIDSETGEKKTIKKVESETRIKAIKVFAEMVGGGLNEKQTNIQNNNYGNVFLDMMSNKTSS